MKNPLNIWRDAWIPVGSRMEMEYVSMRELMERAHELQEFQGDVDPMNFVLLRWMEAFLLSVLYAQDHPTESSVMEHWKQWMKQGRFSMEELDAYAEPYLSRMELRDEQAPLMQMNMREQGVLATRHSGWKLDGRTDSSANKKRKKLRMDVLQEHELAPEDALLWMLYRQAYADNACKPKTGQGWCSQFQAFWMEGDTLFQTLMLNLMPLTHTGRVWADSAAEWEREVPDHSIRQMRSVPDNLPELYTNRFRQMELLWNEEDRVIGFYEAGGSGWSRVNALAEPFALFVKKEEPARRGKRKRKNAAGSDREWIPAASDVQMELWERLVKLLDMEGESGIWPLGRWLKRAAEEAGEVLPGIVWLHSTGVLVEKKGMSVTALLSDQMPVPLFLWKNEEVRTLVQEELSRLQGLAGIAGDLFIHEYMLSCTMMDLDRKDMECVYQRGVQEFMHKIALDISSFLYHLKEYMTAEEVEEQMRELDQKVLEQAMDLSRQLEQRSECRKYQFMEYVRLSSGQMEEEEGTFLLALERFRKKAVKMLGISGI